MADERDFELLDDYLSNRMREENRTAFEQKIKADPALQEELALQKRLIQGIKQARISELKSMLNNVPVPPAPGAGNTLAFKIAIAAVATLIVAAVSYWSLKKEEHAPQMPAQKIQSEQPVPADETAKPQVQPETKTEQQVAPRVQERADADRNQDKNQTSAGTEHSKPSLAKKPDPLSAPAARNPVAKNEAPPGEDDSSRAPANQADLTLTPVTTTLAVETDRNDSRYTFHYQFRDGKLFLFGPFENNRYEVVEFMQGEKRLAFLVYKDQYYALEQTDEQIRPLAPVSDQTLIQKLKEHRSSK